MQSFPCSLRDFCSEKHSVEDSTLLFKSLLSESKRPNLLLPVLWSRNCVAVVFTRDGCSFAPVVLEFSLFNPGVHLLVVLDDPWKHRAVTWLHDELLPVKAVHVVRADVACVPPISQLHSSMAVVCLFEFSKIARHIVSETIYQRFSMLSEGCCEHFAMTPGLIGSQSLQFLTRVKQLRISLQDRIGSTSYTSLSTYEKPLGLTTNLSNIYCLFLRLSWDLWTHVFRFLVRREMFWID